MIVGSESLISISLHLVAFSCEYSGAGSKRWFSEVAAENALTGFECVLNKLDGIVIQSFKREDNEIVHSLERMGRMEYLTENVVL